MILNRVNIGKEGEMKKRKIYISIILILLIILFSKSVYGYTIRPIEPGRTYVRARRFRNS